MERHEWVEIHMERKRGKQGKEMLMLKGMKVEVKILGYNLILCPTFYPILNRVQAYIYTFFPTFASCTTLSVGVVLHSLITCQAVDAL
jgi:hypothetical protein